MTQPAAINVAEFQKNSRETVRVDLSEFNGHKLLNVRAWATKQDGAAIPTKAGLAIQIHLIAELRAALDEAERKAREIGWLRDSTPTTPNAAAERQRRYRDRQRNERDAMRNAERDTHNNVTQSRDGKSNGEAKQA